LTKISRICARFRDYLLEELGALDVEEEALDLLAAFFGDFLGEVCFGDGLAIMVFAAAGGAVESTPLGGGACALVVVGIEVGQLDGVLDGLDLVAEAADVLVAMSGTSSRVKVFDFALGELSKEVAGLGVEEQVIAGLEALGAQGLGDDADLCLRRRGG